MNELDKILIVMHFAKDVERDDCPTFHSEDPDLCDCKVKPMKEILEKWKDKELLGELRKACNGTKTDIKNMMIEIEERIEEK